MEQLNSLEERLQIAIAAIPSNHRIAPPRATAPAILPAQQRLSQIPHSSRGPTGRVRAKSKHQLKLESQERADATKKDEARAKREAAKARKEAKLMAPRKEDVSQLEEEFRMLN